MFPRPRTVRVHRGCRDSGTRGEGAGTCVLYLLQFTTPRSPPGPCSTLDRVSDPDSTNTSPGGLTEPFPVTTSERPTSGGSSVLTQ